MTAYTQLLEHVMANGRPRGDRTGTGTISVFGYQMRMDMKDGFPIPTEKFVPFKPNVAELKWYLLGLTSAEQLSEMGAKVWDLWGLSEDVNQRVYLNDHQRFTWFFTDKEMNPKDALALLREQGDDEAQRKYIDDYGVPKYTDELCIKKGELGPIYGAQWRKFTGVKVSPKSKVPRIVTVDQIQELVDGLRNNPYSRRHIVNSWNPAVLPEETCREGESMKMLHDRNIYNGNAVLPPCHTFFQCYVSDLSILERTSLFNENTLGIVMKSDDTSTHETHTKVLDEYNIPKQRLDLHLYMRSCDAPIGLPFNITCYALLLHLLAKTVNMIPGELIISFGDLHIYQNQVEQVKELLSRESKPYPKLVLPKDCDLFNFTIDEVVDSLIGYQHSGVLKIPVSL